MISIKYLLLILNKKYSIIVTIIVIYGVVAFMQNCDYCLIVLMSPLQVCLDLNIYSDII